MTSTIQGIAVDPTPPASGEGLIFNGTLYVPTPANPGDITAVNTTLPLTGGGVSGALTLDINNFTGDAGAGGLDGAVPAPAAGDAAAGKFLKADGGWAVPQTGGVDVLAYLQDNTIAQTNSTVYVDLPNMDAGSLVTSGGDILVKLECTCGSNAGAGGRVGYFVVLVDGVIRAGKAVGENTAPSASWTQSVTVSCIVSGLPAGNHTVKAQWKSFSANNIFTNWEENLETPTILQVMEL